VWDFQDKIESRKRYFVVKTQLEEETCTYTARSKKERERTGTEQVQRYRIACLRL
jgi:hypothetical protein